MKRKLDIEVVCRTQNNIGESPIWSVAEQCLYWVDIGGKTINRLDLNGQHASWNTGGRVGAVGLRTGGGLIATMPDGVYAATLGETPGGAADMRPIVRPEVSHGVRIKEGKMDRNGRYWFGSTGPTRQTRDGSLFRLTPDGGLRTMDEGFILVNGIAASPDGRTLTMADSPDNVVYAYDLDPTTGSVSNRRQFFSTAEFPGVVDGATFDADGCFWCAFIYDWSVGRIDPTGRLDRLVRLPTRNPTMCAFGGPDLDILYVTTATNHLSDAERVTQLEAGMVFAIHGLGVQGVPEPSFGPAQG